MTTTVNAAHLYKITDAVGGQFYIGKHRGVEQNGYWGSGIRIMRHVKKYGTQNLKYEVLLIANEKYVFEAERAYMKISGFLQDPNCLNICGGGIGGNFGGEPHNKGKKTPDAVRKKQSLAKLGKPSPRLGVKHTQETIEKLRALPRKPVLAQAREKLSKAHVGRKHQLITCQHCGKTGGVTAMPRWHMDRCRYKGV